MSERFIAAIDRAHRKLGYADRAKFIRAAVEEKLQSMGYPVEKEDTLAPARTNPAKLLPGPNLSPKLIEAADKIGKLAEGKLKSRKRKGAV